MPPDDSPPNSTDLKRRMGTDFSLAWLLPVCLATAVAASSMAWSWIGRRLTSGLPVLHRQATSSQSPSLWAMLAATGWIGLSLVDRIFAEVQAQPAEPHPGMVWSALALSGVVFIVILALLLSDSRYQVTDLGLNLSRWRESLGLGFGTFCASILPTVLALLCTLPLRSRETQHTLLRLLAESPDPLVIFGLTCTAVIAAPLSEELLFRVTLQGWWQQRIGSKWAVPVIALLFAMVHGYRDGLALIPLALLLGYVYDRQRDYLAVVVAHALFNAGNLVLALIAMQAQSPAPQP